MDVLCEVCGAVGFRHLFVQCNSCKDSTRHRYCMDTIVYDGPSIEWLCDDCLPKCNEPVESLEGFSNQREQNHIQLYPSMNSMEDLDLSNENDSCFPPKHIEEPFPQGTNSDSFPLINDVERYHQCATDNSFSMLPSSEQAAGSSGHMVESVEQPHPVEVVKPDSSDHSALDTAIGSKGTICFQNITGNFDPTLNSILTNMEQAVGNDDEQSHPSVLGSRPTIRSEEQVDGSSSTLDRSKQLHPLEAIPPLVNMPKGIQGSESVSNYSQPTVQDSYQNIGSDPSNASIVFLDSRSMSKAVEPSCFSNGQEGSTIEKDGPDRTKCVLDKGLIAPASDNLKGSNLSLAKDCLVSNADNSDEINVSDKHLLGISSMPVMSAPIDQQCCITTQPIDQPCWTGLMNIGPEYISLTAHLSNKACRKVQELARSLPPVMIVMEHPELKVWPSSWEELEPIAESISLYFFPDNTRPNKDLDRLMKYVTNHSIVLKYGAGLANLLIFHSIFLPEKFRMFQGKHFLWGVFKHEKVMSKGDLPATQQDCTSQVVKKRKDKQHKVQVDTRDQEKAVPLVKKQDCTSQFAKKRKDPEDRTQADTLDQEKPVPSVKKQDCKSQVVNKRKNHPEKVKVDTLDQEKPVSKHHIPSDNQPMPDTINDVNSAQTLSIVLTKPGDDGKAVSSLETPAVMLSGLADAKTPRSRRDLRLNLKELIRLNLFPLKPG